MPTKINVVIADDHSLMRNGITTLIARNGCEVIAEAASFPELEKAISNITSVDLLISDCRMKGKGPLNFLNLIKRRHEHCKVIFLTGLESGILFKQLLDAGADGLVSKRGDPTDIVTAIDKVMKGDNYISDIFQQEIDDAAVLTTAEYRVLELVIQGLSNKQIADQLNNAAGTINSHRVNIMQKLKVHSVVDLVHFCRKNGFFDS